MESITNLSLPTVAPYGSWSSPITADLVTSAVVGLTSVQFDDGAVCWLELRPVENGRSVVVRREPDGRVTDAIPAPFNARSRVHEYGGGSYVSAGGTVYFSNFSDNGIYAARVGIEPKLLAAGGKCRYADFVVDQVRNRLVCIMEDHSMSDTEPKNSLVSVSLTDGAVEILIDGADFYSSPALSPDGSTLSWLAWNHPNMPWDGTQLFKGNLLFNGAVGEITAVAGGDTESIFQPSWSPDNILHFVSDRSGWWNLYRSVDGISDPIIEMAAEFGMPQWVFGQTTYGFVNDAIYCTYTAKGVWRFAQIDRKNKSLVHIETPYTVISSLVAGVNSIAFIAASPTEMASVILFDTDDRSYSVLKASSVLEIDDRYIATAQAIEFPTSGDKTAHAIYYPPKNADFAAPADEKPPLLVACHGGPTSASYGQLSLSIQYWTSRGFAYVSVNYGGSTGYGREYRDRLIGKWGIIDVEDSINCAKSLAKDGLVDDGRLTIHGGSAGGYTALASLTFHDSFSAGASLYGVSDLETLAADTHKFESRYLDRLIGPYPERRELYIERSPIHFVDQISSPVIFFQGLDDKVVPPDQAVKMVDALICQKIPVAYMPFEGEGHGFRKSESIKRCLETHLYFYARIFGIVLAAQTEVVEIVGLDKIG